MQTKSATFQEKKTEKPPPQGFDMFPWPEAKYILGNNSKQLFFRLFLMQL